MVIVQDLLGSREFQGKPSSGLGEATMTLTLGQQGALTRLAGWAGQSRQAWWEQWVVPRAWQQQRAVPPVET